jgi:hypothetical protein
MESSGPPLSEENVDAMSNGSMNSVRKSVVVAVLLQDNRLSSDFKIP